MTPLNQARKYAAAVKALSLDPDLEVPVWDKAKCKHLGYDCAAAVVLEGTPFGAVDELIVASVDGYGHFALKGMTKEPGVYAEPYASWLLLFFKD